MSDNIVSKVPEPIGAQIRRLRLKRRLSLAKLATLVGTSAPTLHRYESGWDRFELTTLRKIAGALDARLDIRLVQKEEKPSRKKPSSPYLLKVLSSLFWDKELTLADLTEYPRWVMCRVLMFGDLKQVRAARAYFGDELLKEALASREMDLRTRNFWKLMLEDNGDAPEGS